jgi:HAD superfamily hydrolase (TIGR01509 family)
MKKFAAIIFDMDGVIVDSEPRHEQAFREVFHELGYGENHGMDFTSYYGRSDRALWIDFVRKHNPPHPIEALVALKQGRFLEILKRDKPIFEGLPDLLAKLARRYRLGVASGSFHPVIDEVLAMKNLRRFFPVVVSVQDVPQGKPAPDVFLRTAQLLGVAPAECCVIEDAPAGVTAALAAGMEVIAITNTLPAEKLAHATHVVDTYEEIEPLLLTQALSPASGG